MNVSSVGSPCPRFRVRGALRDAGQDIAAIMDRSTSNDQVIRARTAEIIERVRSGGDAELFALARELDGVELESLEIGSAVVRRALDGLEPALRAAMERAAGNIATAHRAFAPAAVEVETEPGVIVGRRADPLGAVGVYAPGGRAAYPSSVLMGAIPARVAGVGTVVLCSPPARDGLPSPVVLAAAALAGVDRVFALGGAGAVAAMAHGTRTVPAVNRIVGPGNAYVAEAKLQVAGSRGVGIDSPAGPSELLVIADDAADPKAVARELLAQAEHDPLAAVVVVALGKEVAVRVERALRGAIELEPREETISRALAARGALLWCDTLPRAIAFANDYAPEHLLLAIRDPEAALSDVRNAGAVFLGLRSSVAFGDYTTGANHVLPTGGSARSYSGLSTVDFVRWTSYQRVSPEAAERLARDTAILARAEGLPGHARAAVGGEGVRKQEAGSSTGADSGRTVRQGGNGVGAAARFNDIALYAPDRAPCAVDLSDNTNLWGAAPSAARVLGEAASAELTRYPAVYADRLKSAIAEYAGVERDEVVTGCGSDDVLDSTMRALAEPGERVAFPDPTFAMARLFARMNGLRDVPVALTARHDIDPEALLATGARIIYLCSPNNPTGLAADREAIERVVRGSPGVVVVDEAYAEFMGEGFLRAAPRYGNLLVVRTFSKAFGLAGLRIGYATGSAALVRAVEKSRGPYKVSALAERAAVSALCDDRAWVEARVAEVRTNRARFAQTLTRLGLAPLPSDSNFLLVPVRRASETARRMRAREGGGVAVRPFEALAGIGDALRVTIGPWPMMESALAAIEEAIQWT